ncbi:cysteine desulfurase family protein [Corynebacterium kozikiae]|uniref:cysteine desulfurase family protein n=1 Tax=Corynebacterium kozikiae TaxID=2968469 RepID=UPI00211C549B|nr:cysteine desulfurase family protein [Corynebacterium sp. 76QC2CO]MCQ9343589.1 cysteine desulfurase [Corynebacterium sp. 76QC2CO]
MEVSSQCYFDHAATTPMRQVAIDAWLEHAHAGNAGGQYAFGRAARSVLDTSRETIAELLGCEPIEVIFTASGTEADNLAVRGLFAASVAGGAARRVISTPIEHPAVKETVEYLEATGADVELLEVGSNGIVIPSAALDTKAAVATCMWANNETGAIQPVEEIIQRALAAGTPVHIDAVQVVGHADVNFHALGATTLAASAHKFGGPRGMGLLLAKRSPAPKAIILGGGQERGLRSGTVDVASAAATAAALREAVQESTGENERLRGLVAELRQGIAANIEDVVFHTPEADKALTGHLHVSFPGAEGDSLIMLLDSRGFAASTGSACANGVNRASHVLLAMGVEESVARAALRVTLGRTTTQEDVQALLQELPEVVRLARSAGMA